MLRTTGWVLPAQLHLCALDQHLRPQAWPHSAHYVLPSPTAFQLREVGSCSICPSVSGIFHLTHWPSGSSMLSQYYRPDYRLQLFAIAWLPLMPLMILPSLLPAPWKRNLQRPNISLSCKSPWYQLWPSYDRRMLWGFPVAPLPLRRGIGTSSWARPFPCLPFKHGCESCSFGHCLPAISPPVWGWNPKLFVELGNKPSPTRATTPCCLIKDLKWEPSHPASHHRTWDMITSCLCRQLRFKVIHYGAMHDWRSPSILEAILDFLEDKVLWPFLASGWISLFYKSLFLFRGERWWKIEIWWQECSLIWMDVSPLSHSADNTRKEVDRSWKQVQEYLSAVLQL